VDIPRSGLADRRLELFGLIADTLRRRRTELVLHRLHGASHAAIVYEVVAEFAVPLLIAAFLGLPLAVWLGQRICMAS
jgi:predicted lysophospholipase L1 biosynthesis ABC-type transport system permease subunit